MHIVTLFHDRSFRTRFLLMLSGVFGMGFFQSFLIPVDYGVGTAAFFCLGFSSISGLTFGTCSLLLNLVCFVPVLLFDRKLIHLGTFAAMVLTGYISDFFLWVWELILPQSLFTVQPWRTVTFVAALIPFLISVALYMNAHMGEAPFDAVPTIVSKRTKAPFAPVRILWDFLFIALGLLTGQILMAATVIMAFAVGPAVSFIGRQLERFIRLD